MPRSGRIASRRPPASPSPLPGGDGGEDGPGRPRGPSGPGGDGPSGGNGGDGARRRDLERVASDGSLKFAGSILSDLFGFFFVLVATHGFGGRNAGHFFEAMALAMICSNIAKLGADTAFVRFIPRYRAQGRVADVRPMLMVGFGPVVLLATLFGAGMFFFGPQLAGLFGRQHPEDLVPYFRLFGVFLPAITAYAVSLAASRGFGSMKPLVVVDNVMVPIGRTAIAAAGALAGLGGLVLGYATTGTMTIGLIVILLWIRRMLLKVERTERSGASGRSGRRALFGEFWTFAGPRGFASIFATFSSNINTLLLGALYTASGVTAFAAASRFMKLGTLALVAIFYTIAPQISGLLAHNERGRAQAVYQVSTWWVMMGSWPVYFVLAVWAPLLMRLFPKGLTGGAEALTILSLGMLVSMACGPVSAILLMGGHAVWNLANTAISLVVNVVLALVLIPHYHVQGAAVATSVGIALNNLLALLEVGVFMRLGTLGPGFGIVAVASAVCFGGLGLVFRFSVGETWATFMLFSVISCGLYLVALLRFRHRLELPLLWETVIRRSGRRRRGGDGDRGGRHRARSVRRSNGGSERAGMSGEEAALEEREARLDLEAEEIQREGP
jgi:O-antigen/teichoic acid export membrane protein